MKKFTYIIAIAAAGLFLASCSEKLGSEPGNDSQPVVTVYNYNPAGAEYDSDTDQDIRFVSNGKVASAYYLAEKTADKKDAIAAQGEAAYIEKVIAQGTPITFTDGVCDVTVTDMAGDYDISVVAVSGNQKVMRAISFSGIAWDVTSSIEGTYYINVSRMQSITGATSFPAVLQRHSTDPTLYRIKGALGPGTKISFKTMDMKGQDNSGEEYTFFRIPEQATPYTFSSYGTVSLRDLGYWQGDDAYVTSYGYESGMYADGYCFLCLHYYVSAGNLGYGWDEFVPND